MYLRSLLGIAAVMLLAPSCHAQTAACLVGTWDISGVDQPASAPSLQLKITLQGTQLHLQRSDNWLSGDFFQADKNAIKGLDYAFKLEHLPMRMSSFSWIGSLISGNGEKTYVDLSVISCDVIETGDGWGLRRAHAPVSTPIPTARQPELVVQATPRPTNEDPRQARQRWQTQVDDLTEKVREAEQTAVDAETLAAAYNDNAQEIGESTDSSWGSVGATLTNRLAQMKYSHDADKKRKLATQLRDQLSQLNAAQPPQVTESTVGSIVDSIHQSADSFVASTKALNEMQSSVMGVGGACCATPLSAAAPAAPSTNAAQRASGGSSSPYAGSTSSPYSASTASPYASTTASPYGASTVSPYAPQAMTSSTPSGNSYAHTASNNSEPAVAAGGSAHAPSQYATDSSNLYQQRSNSQYAANSSSDQSSGTDTASNAGNRCMSLAIPQAEVTQSTACGGGPGAIRFTITNSAPTAIDCAFSYDKNRPRPFRDGEMLNITHGTSQSDWTCGVTDHKVQYACFEHDTKDEKGVLCVSAQTFSN